MSSQRGGHSLLCIMWMCIATLLLWARSGGCTEKANTSDLIEYTAADFYEKLHSGKMMFIYFEHKGRTQVNNSHLYWEQALLQWCRHIDISHMNHKGSHQDHMTAVDCILQKSNIRVDWLNRINCTFKGSASIWIYRGVGQVFRHAKTIHSHDFKTMDVNLTKVTEAQYLGALGSSDDFEQLPLDLVVIWF